MFSLEEKEDEQFTSINFSQDGDVADRYERCFFSNCSFQNVELEKVQFYECQFEKCNLSMIQTQDMTFKFNQLSRCKILAVDWTLSKDFHENSFKDCLLESVNFSLLKLDHMSFAGSKLHHVEFSESSLKEANFENCDLKGSQFFQTDLRKANFTGASNYQIDVQNNKVNKAKFTLPEAINLLHSLDIQLT